MKQSPTIVSRVKSGVLRTARNHWPIIVLSLIFLAICLRILPLFQYQVNPDGLSYISITDKYASGDFRHAINGYWGPLLSWLAVPLWWLGVSSGILFKFLQIVFIIGLINITYATLKRSVSTSFALLGATLVGVFGIEWGLAGPITPDLLVCLLTVCLFYVISKPASQLTTKTYVLIGVLGALLYYAKSAGFYLFVLIWLGWVAYDYLTARTRSFSLVKKRSLALFVCVLLVLPFWIVISIKYQKPTIGTAGTYNFALVGPYTQGHPLTTQLVPPPNSTAVTSWEDPSRLEVRRFTPLASKLEFKALLINVRNNTKTAVKTIGHATLIVPAIVLVYLLWKSKTKEERRNKVLLVGCSLATIALYIPIFIELRYMIFAMVAVIIGLVTVMHRTHIAKNFGGSRAFVVLGLISAILLVQHSIPRTKHVVNMDKQIHDQAQLLKDDIGPGDRVAGDFFESVYACFYTKSACYGPLATQDPTAIKELKTFGIQYLLLTPASAEIVRQHNVQLEQVGEDTYLQRQLYRIDQYEQ